MIISSHHLDYLTGRKFSNSYHFLIRDRDRETRSRIAVIEDLIRDKKIIHLGCTDHLEEIDEKIKNDNWLHGRLVRISQRCLGIDINDQAIQYLKDKYHYRDLIAADITSDEIPEIETGHWDYLVMGEILEHIPDPVSFLRRIRERYQNRIDRILITVPNAFSLQNQFYTGRRMELINSDHYYWFTPYTLSRIAAQAGFVPEEIRMVQNFGIRRLNLFRYLSMAFQPLKRDTLMLIARFQL